MEIKIIKVSAKDTLIFKFDDMKLSIEDLNTVSENLNKITGCSVITLDNQCDLVAVLKKKD